MCCILQVNYTASISILVGGHTAAGANLPWAQWTSMPMPQHSRLKRRKHDSSTFHKSFHGTLLIPTCPTRLIHRLQSLDMFRLVLVLLLSNFTRSLLYVSSSQVGLLPCHRKP